MFLFLKKYTWCAWDSYPGRQDGRHRQIHLAMAAPLVLCFFHLMIVSAFDKNGNDCFPRKFTPIGFVIRVHLVLHTQKFVYIDGRIMSKTGLVLLFSRNDFWKPNFSHFARLFYCVSYHGLSFCVFLFGFFILSQFYFIIFLVCLIFGCCTNAKHANHSVLF